MFRRAARPLGQPPELRRRELRAIVFRGNHYALDALLGAPVLPNLGVAANASGAFETLAACSAEPLTLPGILDIDHNVVATSDIRNHLDTLHSLRDGVRVDLGEVLAV